MLYGIVRGHYISVCKEAAYSARPSVLAHSTTGPQELIKMSWFSGERTASRIIVGKWYPGDPERTGTPAALEASTNSSANRWSLQSTHSQDKNGSPPHRLCQSLTDPVHRRQTWMIHRDLYLFICLLTKYVIINSDFQVENTNRPSYFVERWER